jgi:hypothetical protein
VAAWPRRLDEQGRESLDPLDEGDVVDLDASFGQ